jgi:uncharacterized membrane protein YphA (DoxX/SURF4 family)/thiol-disulfide isomerase/thioredoxin
MRSRIQDVVQNRWLLLGSRLVLGGIFIAASITKLQDQSGFVDDVVRYGILPDILAQLYGIIVPWLELLIGCSLILGIFSRLASAVSIPLIISFIVASSYRLVNPVEGGCGCFGEVITLSYPVSLTLDAVMLLSALLLLLSKMSASFLSVGALAFWRKIGFGRRATFVFENTGKLAVVACAMVPAIVLFGGVTVSLGRDIETAPVSEAGGLQNSPATELDYDALEMSLRREIDSALEQGKPAFLFFYIEGCPPCEEQKPVINELMQEYSRHVVFMDIDMSGPVILEELDAHEPPTILLITGKDAEGEYVVYQRFEDITKKETLIDGIERALLEE